MGRTSSRPADSSAAKSPLLDVSKLVEQYVKLRDRKRVIEQQQKEVLDPFVKIMGEIEGKLLQYMQEAEIDHIATSHGTAYQSTTPRATIQDRKAFRDFIIECELWEMVDWKANPRAVFEYIKGVDGSPPPGVNASTSTAVRFRSPGEKE